MSKQILFARPAIGAKILVDMTHESLAVIVVGSAAAILALLAVAIKMLRAVSVDLRVVWRQGRALGGLVYQEEQKTRALIRDIGGRT